MPAYRIVYLRDEGRRPETVTAGFGDLGQAMDVFAARGLRILYIAEQRREARTSGAIAKEGAARPAESERPARAARAFPLRRFSARVMA